MTVHYQDVYNPNDVSFIYLFQSNVHLKINYSLFAARCNYATVMRAQEPLGVRSVHAQTGRMR